MAVTKRGQSSLAGVRSVLHRLIDLPDLPARIEALPAETFAALVREVGLEDAGELVALATTEQLVQTFDEDLFVNARAGERETFDVERFGVWLEVLLEAGDEAAADRVAELDEDFVALALGSILLVVEEDALRERMDEVDEDESSQVDKSLESALTEEIDGYLLVAKRHDGWDAALSLVLALDKNHRALLSRILDRLARTGSRYLGELDELSTVLSEGESLAEDVEAVREERRTRLGYVEPRAARAFLNLAREKPSPDEKVLERDALTRAYFREVDRTKTRPSRTSTREPSLALPLPVLKALEAAQSSDGDPTGTKPPSDTTMSVFVQALRELHADEPSVFDERMEEFAYLANVLVAGQEKEGSRLRPKEAADAALATACFGAVLELRTSAKSAARREAPTPSAFATVLRERSVDLLFRQASAELLARTTKKKSALRAAVLYSEDELEDAIRRSTR